VVGERPPHHRFLLLLLHYRNCRRDSQRLLVPGVPAIHPDRTLVVHALLAAASLRHRPLCRRLARIVGRIPEQPGRARALLARQIVVVGERPPHHLLPHGPSRCRLDVAYLLLCPYYRTPPMQVLAFRRSC